MANIDLEIIVEIKLLQFCIYKSLITLLYGTQRHDHFEMDFN